MSQFGRELRPADLDALYRRSPQSSGEVFLLAGKKKGTGTIAGPPNRPH